MVNLAKNNSSVKVIFADHVAIWLPSTYFFLEVGCWNMSCKSRIDLISMGLFLQIILIRIWYFTAPTTYFVLEVI